jgi:hypothetical protein
MAASRGHASACRMGFERHRIVNHNSAPTTSVFCLRLVQRRLRTIEEAGCDEDLGLREPPAGQQPRPAVACDRVLRPGRLSERQQTPVIRVCRLVRAERWISENHRAEHIYHAPTPMEMENTRLKKLVAELSLDKAVLQDVLAKKLPGPRS